MNLKYYTNRPVTNSEHFRRGANMKDSIAWITPKQAALLAGYSTRHIQNYITKGKLSASREDGKYYIDKSEFFRVFPKAHKKEQEGNAAHNESEKMRLEFENEMLKDISSKKDKEIEFLRSQMQFVSHEKAKMLEAIVNQTRLLEHQSSVPEKGSIKKKAGKTYSE